jgi:ElaB/YqjD/DUF883 family membrane-anchored ribosome-binding protein
MSSVANSSVVRMKDFRTSDVGERVSKALNTFTDQVTDSVQEWQSKARSAARSTDNFVRSSPWQVVGAVALAGLATGVLVTMSARRARQLARDGYTADATAETLGG